METKRSSRASSPCERFLNTIRTSPALRMIRRSRVPRDEHVPIVPSSSPPLPPPKMHRTLTITTAANGKEKVDSMVQNSDGDQVLILKSAKIAPAADQVPPAGRGSKLEKTKPHVTAQIGQEIPGVRKKIELEPSKEAANGEENSSFSEVQTRESNKKGSAGVDHIENQFSNFIERAKLKLRTVSNVGGGGTKSEPGKDKKDLTRKTDEHFTNYINKAKAKLRTTSSIGGGKAFPSK